uniref:RING-type E3 ubiquitin transferase n=1 Tax=Meleagris gallopavo TaxID=9103 RepID=A0A803XRE0_MELGA
MDDASYVMPCLHQFCFGCIRQWAERRPTCPLCKGTVESILHSVPLALRLLCSLQSRAASFVRRLVVQ